MTNEAERLGGDFTEQLHWLAANRVNDGRIEFAFMPAGGELILPSSR